MGQYETERILAVLHVLSACSAIISLSSTAAAWTHWSEVLDTCPDYRCGCILYGYSSFDSFRGGRNPACHFTTFAPIPVIIISFILAGYHGYHVCIVTRRRKPSPRRTQRSRRGNRDVAIEEPAWAGSDPACTCWIALAILAAAVACLLVVNAAILTHGFFETCDEYSRTLVKYLVATGQTAAVIYGRLSCGAIYDFMDYLEPVTRPFRELEGVDYGPRTERRDFYRGDFINTGVALQLAMAFTWINFIIWFAAIVYYSILARENGRCLCCNK
ncbi:uncharacterized protein [Anabrus simplex]|uniref:uncharacterized protein n=1 Tax=Anabrus simplex TaxID=316456 RepID=UPI0035A350DE